MDKGGISVVGSKVLEGDQLIMFMDGWNTSSTAQKHIEGKYTQLQNNIEGKYTQIKGQLSKPVCTMCTMSQVCKWTKPALLSMK